MAQIIFVRHGESSANVAKVLAGRSAGVVLTERGRAQARALAGQLAQARPAVVVRSTLQRCEQTAALALPGLEAREDPAFDEVDYGSWSGRPLADLGKLEEWRDLLRDPAAMTFPDGESLAQAQERTLAGVRRVLGELRALEGEAAAGPSATPAHSAARAAAPNRTAVVFAHGDIVKLALLDALGVGVAGLHRITVATGSMSVVHYPSEGAPTVCAISVMGPESTGTTSKVNTNPGTLGG